MIQTLMYESKSTKQGSDVLNESLELGRFSCLELARMRMPGFPTTEQGWGKVVAREKWPWIEVQAKGGKNGVKRVYTPPPALLDVIRRHSRGEVVTEAVVAAARAQPASGQVQHQGVLDEKGRYQAQTAAQHHDMGKGHPAVQKAAEGAGARVVVQQAAGAGKTLGSVAATMTMMSAQALSAGFRRAIWLVDAGQAELLVLGNRTIARLEEESVRRQIKPEALVSDTEIIDAALRLEWLLMQREPQVSPADQL